MCHPSKSDIVNYPRIMYFTSAESFTNIYNFSTGVGRGSGHKWKNVDMTEIVQFNGILVRGGVLGGSNGTLYEQWNHNPLIYSA